ncbi:MAG: AAA-associated domain-containing protein [archaeon]|nr:AAA-associated domain-containing protein [archaeon]
MAVKQNPSNGKIMNGPSSSPSIPTSALVMPAGVRAGQVIGLVEITGGLGSVIDASRLADEFGADLSTLLPILDGAEMLGLVKTDKGDVSLTEFGLKFQKTSKQKIKLLKDVLAKIEPFKTTLELLASKKSVSVHEISDALKVKDIRWHYRDEINEMDIQTILIHWAIYGELLTYNGKNGKFQKI